MPMAVHTHTQMAATCAPRTLLRHPKVSLLVTYGLWGPEYSPARYTNRMLLKPSIITLFILCVNVCASIDVLGKLHDTVHTDCVCLVKWVQIKGKIKGSTFQRLRDVCDILTASVWMLYLRVQCPVEIRTDSKVGISVQSAIMNTFLNHDDKKERAVKVRGGIFSQKNEENCWYKMLKRKSWEGTCDVYWHLQSHGHENVAVTVGLYFC